MVSGFMVSGFIQIGIEIAIGIDCCDHSVARNDECKSEKFGVRRQAVFRTTPLFEMMRDKALSKIPERRQIGARVFQPVCMSFWGATPGTQRPSPEGAASP